MNTEIDMQRMARILEISRELSSTTSLVPLLHRIVHAAADLTGSETAGILLLDARDSGTLRFMAASQFADQLYNLPVPVEGSIAGSAFASGEPVVVNDVRGDPRYYPEVEYQIDYAARSLLAVPLCFRGRCIGVLEAENKRQGAFDARDIETLVSLAAQAAVAIENARLVEALRQARDRLEERVERRTAQLAAANAELEREITDRKLVEAELRESGARFQRIVENAPFGYYRVARDGTWQYVNQTWEQMHGYRLHEVIGKRFELTQPEPLREQAREIVEKALAGEALAGEFERQRKDGTVEHHAYNAQPVYHGEQIIAIEGFIRDITQRKATEAAIREAAAAAERDRLARDLHDAVTQTLFSAGLIAEVLPNLWQINPQEAERNLGKLRDMIRGATAEMRTLLLELRPASLTEKKLSLLLQHLSEALSNRARISVETTLDEACAPPPEVQIALYRIVQEAFNNIAKHADAGQARLTLRRDDRRIEVLIADDGCGFDPAEIPPGHLGVGIMRERAETSGATLTIESEIGRGTVVRVVWEDDKERMTKG